MYSQSEVGCISNDVIDNACWQIVISKFVSNIASATVQLLGIEPGSGAVLSRSYDISSISVDSVS